MFDKMQVGGEARFNNSYSRTYNILGTTLSGYISQVKMNSKGIGGIPYLTRKRINALSIIARSGVCIGVEGGPEKLNGNHKLFLSVQWRIVRTDHHSCCVQGTTLCQPRMLTPDPLQNTKSLHRIQGLLVYARCEATVLLSGLVVPVVIDTGECSWMRLDERLVLQPEYIVEYVNK